MYIIQCISYCLIICLCIFVDKNIFSVPDLPLIREFFNLNPQNIQKSSDDRQQKGKYILIIIFINFLRNCVDFLLLFTITGYYVQ